MATTITVDGKLFVKMVASGASRLRDGVKEINDLNVFPIPDGDTGDNMLMTIMGGIFDAEDDIELHEAAKRVSGGMLLSARGNSGVILSQFFEGVAIGLGSASYADATVLGEAFRYGVAQAYRSVMEPTEGTVLTVMREATEKACAENAQTIENFFEAFLSEAKSSLERTPELLPVLKRAGVVDSGGAGFIRIAEGMLEALSGAVATSDNAYARSAEAEINYSAFDENSTLEFGYCTELLLRLQNSKTNISSFDTSVITERLKEIGNSIVAVCNGSVVKLHVHTMTPDRVLAIGREYGEFLKVKIENMSLQHNNALSVSAEDKKRERKKYGVVAVASGDGLKQMFIDRGADVIVSGGQSMNPSAEEFLEAFEKVNADVVFVFPNNGNIILTAKQAAGLYTASDVYVIESHTVGDGYAALSMLDTGVGDADAIATELTDAMSGVVTAEISRCVREASTQELSLHIGDYIGFVGKDIIAAAPSRLEAVYATLDKLELKKYDICLVICGKEATDEEAEKIERYININYRGKEVYIINGMQDVYDYILIVE